MDEEPATADQASDRRKHRSRTRSNKQRSLREITAEAPDLADFMDILGELEGQHDRAAAIILAAQVESALRAVILSRMVPFSEKDEADLFGPPGPLCTFSGKIKIAFGLGAYGPDTRVDLETIREIRNAFAHARKPIKFETPEIAEKCAKLRAPDWISPDDVNETPWPPTNPRSRYLAAIKLLWIRLGRCPARYKWSPPERCPLLV